MKLVNIVFVLFLCTALLIFYFASDEISIRRQRIFVQAAWNGEIQKMKWLYMAGADINEFSQGYGSALINAAWNGQNDAISFLLNHGADVNVKGKFNLTALMVAAREGHTETMRLLLEKGANVNARDTDEGYTVLMQAAYGGHLEAVKLLLSNGADLNARATYATNLTALKIAKNEEHTEVVNFLINAGAIE
jgi:ankyrin repeat protein